MHLGTEWGGMTSHCTSVLRSACFEATSLQLQVTRRQARLPPLPPHQLRRRQRPRLPPLPRPTTTIPRTHMRMHLSIPRTHMWMHRVNKLFQRTHMRMHRVNKLFQRTHMRMHHANKLFPRTHMRMHQRDPFQTAHHHYHHHHHHHCLTYAQFVVAGLGRPNNMLSCPGTCRV